MILDLGARQLVQGDPMAPRCREGATRALGNIEGRFTFPPPCLEPVKLPAEVVHSVDQYRAFALQMIGEQDPRGTFGQLDHRHPRAHPLNFEYDSCADDFLEILGVAGHVRAWGVDEVESIEEQFSRS